MNTIADSSVKQELAKIQEDYANQLKAINTGRPRPEMLESIMVEVYGGMMELKSLTSIEVLDGKFRLQPWDASVRKAIDTAIRNSNLGLNPDIKDDGIYVPLPALTQETRQKRVKQVMDDLESAKVRVRQLRHKYLDQINKAESVSEDVKKSDEKALQKMVDEGTTQLGELAKAKEAELLKV